MKLTISGKDAFGQEVVREYYRLRSPMPAERESEECRITEEPELTVSVLSAAPDRLPAPPAQPAQELPVVILPREGGYTPADYPTSGRSIIFVPQTKTEFESDSEYRDFCLNEAARILERIELLAVYSTEPDYMCYDDIDFVHTLNCFIEEKRRLYAIEGKGSFKTCAEKLMSDKQLCECGAIILKCFISKETVMDDFTAFSPALARFESVCVGIAFVDDKSEEGFTAIGVSRL
ncbi:MAG: hypothetical protein ACI4KM_08190 [Oscillospiraceae bacterium]